MATSKGKTNAQLVEEYNALNPAKPLKNWKGKKEVLIAKINAAQKQSGAPGTTTKKKSKKKGKKAVSTTGKSKRTGEIRELCETLLSTVAYHENKSKDVGPENVLKNAGKNTRPVGLSFAEILGDVKRTFPDANTSYACLRWYAVHMRRAGAVLPRRPKSSWK